MSNTPNKPSSAEEDFFAREELEKLRKLHATNQAARSSSERDAAKKLHHMKCPKCGSDLTEVGYKDIQLDRCFSCNGVWLDAGELEQISGRDDGYVRSILKFFKV